MYNKTNPAYLLLADGTFYKGISVGKKGTTVGEICFNTGMTGYQEVFTDPSYFGQIIVETNCHIGNYGVKNNEVESDSIKISGMICREFSHVYSRKSADGSLQNYFEEQKLVAIADIDTRSLVRHIRKNGTMNCIISSEIEDINLLKAELEKAPNMDGLELSSKVSTKEAYYYGDENSPLKVAVLDLGIKRNILEQITSRGVYCKVFPAKTSYSEMKEWNPDGYFISNGPGDPAATNYAIETVRNILNDDNVLFGICLGHQILSLANGISTYKMHNGHRGLNHPVKNLLTGKSEITSQNHGFAVKKVDVDNVNTVEVTHINLNDNTIEGIKLKNKKAFSVQYHPEASPGPHDSRYLFDDFIKLLKK
jgi:carbamoyl-phosphate synthase small subunit